jgi:hypothetical protein
LPALATALEGAARTIEALRFFVERLTHGLDDQLTDALGRSSRAIVRWARDADLAAGTSDDILGATLDLDGGFAHLDQDILQFTRDFVAAGNASGDLNIDLRQTAKDVEAVGDAVDGSSSSFRDLKVDIEGLALATGESFQDISDAGHEAFVEDGQTFGKNWHAFIEGVIQDVQDMQDEISDNVNFIDEKFGSLVDSGNVTASGILDAFEDAAKATKDYGDDLLEVASIGDGEGKDLSLWLQSLGPDGAAAANEIANASGEMQRSIVEAFNEGEQSADNIAEKLTRRVVGVLTDIRELLEGLMVAWDIPVDADTERAKTALDVLSGRYFALRANIASHPINIGVTTSGGTSLIGGPQVGTATGGIVTAASGLVTRGPTILAGEGAYSTFAGKGAEAVIPLNGRGIDILGEAIRRASGKMKDSGSRTMNIELRPDRRRFTDAIDYDAQYRGW